jgi:hypothetical protein
MPCRSAIDSLHLREAAIHKQFSSHLGRLHRLVQTDDDSVVCIRKPYLESVSHHVSPLLRLRFVVPNRLR